MLLSYVQEIEPSIVQHFVDKAPAQVVDAMQHSVSNMLGTLPPAFFNVTINTHGENLAQLMFSVLMTGYLMSNAQARLQLTQSLALPSGMCCRLSVDGYNQSSSCTCDTPSTTGDATGTSLFPTDTNASYAPGTQKNVQGNVILWNNVQGPQAVPAARYIESLEEELTLLRQQLAQHKTFAQQVPCCVGVVVVCRRGVVCKGGLVYPCTHMKPIYTGAGW